MKKNQLGFTLYELIIVLMFIACFGLGSLALWAIIHFISKFW